MANYATPMDPNEVQWRTSLNATKTTQQNQLDEQKRQFDLTMAARQRALQSLTSQISATAGGAGGTLPMASVGGGSGGGGTYYSPPSSSTASGYQDTADSKAYARAKDNTGAALAASLKGLQATMAARGISGSGIEGAETEKLFQGGLSDLANTDATQAGKTAEHAFTDEQAGKARGEQAREFDVGQSTDVSKFNAGLIADKQSKTLSSILQAYGSLY
jgi:hypothetical protein